MTNGLWARAEGFIDVYAGRSSAEARDLTIRADETRAIAAR